MSAIRERIIDGVQQAYNAHRAPELHGSPQTSTDFFDRLRENGILAAIRGHHVAHDTIGNPRIPQSIRTAGSLVASAVLASGVVDDAREIIEGRRSVGRIARAGASAVYHGTIGLAMMSDGGNPGLSGDEYLHGDDSQAQIDDGGEALAIAAQQLYTAERMRLEAAGDPHPHYNAQVAADNLQYPSRN